MGEVSYCTVKKWKLDDDDDDDLISIRKGRWDYNVKARFWLGKLPRKEPGMSCALSDHRAKMCLLMMQEDIVYKPLKITI